MELKKKFGTKKKFFFIIINSLKGKENLSLKKKKLFFSFFKYLK